MFVSVQTDCAIASIIMGDEPDTDKEEDESLATLVKRQSVGLQDEHALHCLVHPVQVGLPHEDQPKPLGAGEDVHMADAPTASTEAAGDQPQHPPPAPEQHSDAGGQQQPPTQQQEAEAGPEGSNAQEPQPGALKPEPGQDEVKQEELKPEAGAKAEEAAGEDVKPEGEAHEEDGPGRSRGSKRVTRQRSGKDSGVAQAKAQPEQPASAGKTGPGRPRKNAKAAQQQEDAEHGREKGRRPKRQRGDKSEDGSEEDAAAEQHAPSRGGGAAGRGRGRGRGRGKGPGASGPAHREEEGEAGASDGPGPSGAAAAAAAAAPPPAGSPHHPRAQDAAPTPQEAIRAIPDPKSKEYKALDRSAKLDAFQAAADAFNAAVKAAEDAGKVVEGLAEAWFFEQFGKDTATSTVTPFKTFQKTNKFRQEHLLKAPLESVTELLRLWKFIYESKEPSKDITADMVRAKAPPAPIKSTAAGPPPQQQRRPAPTAAAAAAGPKPAAGPQPQPQQGAKGAKTEGVSLPALLKQTPPSSKEEPKPSPVTVPLTAAQGMQPQQQAGAFATPSQPSEGVVSLVSFQSTGDVTRDRTVAALHQALSSTWAVDVVDTALEVERHVFEAFGQRGEDRGGVGAAYMRRAFLLWSLLAPDSDAFCSDVQESLLEGLLSPEQLARTEFGEQPAAEGRSDGQQQRLPA